MANDILFSDSPFVFVIEHTQNFETLAPVCFALIGMKFLSKHPVCSINTLSILRPEYAHYKTHELRIWYRPNPSDNQIILCPAYFKFVHNPLDGVTFLSLVWRARTSTLIAARSLSPSSGLLGFILTATPSGHVSKYNTPHLFLKIQ